VPQFENGGVTIHAVVDGPEDGPVVLLLHGFPEFWYSWHRQIAPLAAAGLRVIVPDQRGYNLSSKPRGTKSYAMAELVADVIAIADQLGQKKIFLAGHDWGAAVAWSVALLHPERVNKLAIVNVPHPLVMAHNLKSNWRQMRKSWYMFCFQLPWVPEKLFSGANFKVAEGALVNSSREGTFSAEDLAKYREAWSQPDALTATINWYRAAFRHRTRFADTRVHVPTRILWGERDKFLSAEMARESLRYCDDAELFTFAEASHWLQHEEAERVSEHLIKFFCAPSV
jgi:epoxide hydrolase 4